MRKLITYKESLQVSFSFIYLLAIFIPLLIAGFFAWHIGKDLYSAGKLSMEYHNQFLEWFKLPVRITGLSIILPGLVFTYQKIRTSERQSKESACEKFREKFMNLIDEQDYEYLTFDIPKSLLFDSLYKKNNKGEYCLVSEFDEFLRDDEVHIDYHMAYGFLANMNLLHYKCTSRDGSKYDAGKNIQPLTAMFMWFRAIVPIDIRINFNSGARHSLFTENNCGHVVNFLRDVFFIACTVNTQEGGEYFDSNTRHNWRVMIDSLKQTMAKAELLKEYLDQYNLALLLVRGDLEELKAKNVFDNFPADLINDQAAKAYIYNIFTEGTLGKVIDDDVKELLADKLGVTPQ